MDNNEGECSKHPCAPHGFNRNASHSEDRYVCDCEGWSPDRTCAGLALQARLAALEAGMWVLVPREPTPEMIAEIIAWSPLEWGTGDRFTADEVRDMWKSAIDAALLNRPADVEADRG